ncbi:MAG: hypothetical protein QOG53_2792 [Frankiales bacterium]|nr:hypothetical protein [Frankiales bacterium]
MIDFRYHVVSIVAVFLALALGIVIGTYTINGQLLKNIRHQVSSLRSQNDGLRGRVQDLERQQRQAGDLVKAVSPLVLQNRLASQRVILVTAPGSSQGLANGVKNAIVAAGGTVGTTVKLDKKWMDPEHTAVVGQLAQSLVEPGVTLPEGSAYQRAGRVLGAALLRHPPAVTVNDPGGLTSAEIEALAGFKAAGLMSVSPNRPAPGTLVVLVVGGAPGQATDATKAAAKTITDLARELDSAGGGAVVVGPNSAAENGGIISVARSDGDTRKSVSTVDDADTESGRIRVVLALAAELGNTSGQYGTGPGANAPLPSPAPLPTP